LKTNANSAVTKFAGGPIEQPHAAVRLNQAVLDGHIAWPDVLPPGEIFAVKKLLPRVFALRITGNGQHRRCRENQKNQMTHKAPICRCTYYKIRMSRGKNSDSLNYAYFSSRIQTLR